MPMAHMTVRYATTRARVARTALVRLDPHLKWRVTWTRYGNNIPRRYTIATDWGHRYATTRGVAASGI